MCLKRNFIHQEGHCKSYLHVFFLRKKKGTEFIHNTKSLLFHPCDASKFTVDVNLIAKLNRENKTLFMRSYYMLPEHRWGFPHEIIVNIVEEHIKSKAKAVGQGKSFTEEKKKTHMRLCE